MDHYNKNEWSWSMRMFGIGFINNAGIGVMMIYTSNLSADFNRNLQYAMFVVFV